MSIFKKIFNRDDVVMSGELSLLREELAGVRDDLRSLEDASFLSRDWELFVSLSLVMLCVCVGLMVWFVMFWVV